MAKAVDVNGWDVGPSICAESLDGPGSCETVEVVQSRQSVIVYKRVGAANSGVLPEITNLD